MIDSTTHYFESLTIQSISVDHNVKFCYTLSISQLISINNSIQAK